MNSSAFSCAVMGDALPHSPGNVPVGTPQGWALRSGRPGAAFYRDRYERGTDGRWRIAHTGYTRTYESMMSLDDLPSFRITARLGEPVVARKNSADAAAE